MTGTLSYHLRRLPHLGQCEGGVTSDSPRGSRQTTTFRKLPTHAPKAKRKTMYVTCWAKGRVAYQVRLPCNSPTLDEARDVDHRVRRRLVRHVEFRGHRRAVHRLALGQQVLDLPHPAGGREVRAVGRGVRVGLDAPEQLGDRKSTR